MSPKTPVLLPCVLCPMDTHGQLGLSPAPPPRLLTAPTCPEAQDQLLLFVYCATFLVSTPRADTSLNHAPSSRPRPAQGWAQRRQSELLLNEGMSK